MNKTLSSQDTVESVIEINEVYKTFQMGKVQVEVLKGINLKIKKGEFVSIMGPSGSGKSALLYLLGILDQPTKGEIKIAGKNVASLVAIARALINSPDIILADEATGNLDSKTGSEILTLLKKIHQEEGKTIIQVTHSDFAAGYGNRIIQIKDGEVV